ncbi:DUF3786 domain-containing protein [Leadbettera azotonutricia]|uniref:DUF3786 domain-containing protein n=1 Tax=Leadbettera azotonutricia (strain ATCC BAA-888 / DSM 13862 / ZAS-9) TaxID=545695 RepID=F5YFF4_LEAAZ|nr:DUF3786 domain-containing protein [Leadbettera azotonutricia]AEF82572.1 hypothetical protein TREAZ_0123 [Leadbettera azotonutricia ZAS-9]
MEKDYLELYSLVTESLSHCDFTEASNRLGIKDFSKDEVFLEFLGREYSIKKSAIDLVKENIIWETPNEQYEYNLKNVLGEYILSKGNTEPKNDFRPIDVYFLTNYFSEHTVLNSFLRKIIFLKSPLDETYASKNHPVKFRKCMSMLGYTCIEEKSANGIQSVWSGSILPKIPIRILYDHEETGHDYPVTKSKLLFDKTLGDYYQLDSFRVLYICYLEALNKIWGKYIEG